MEILLDMLYFVVAMSKTCVHKHLHELKVFKFFYAFEFESITLKLSSFTNCIAFIFCFLMDLFLFQPRITDKNYCLHLLLLL